MNNPLLEPSVSNKIKLMPSAIHNCLMGGAFAIPQFAQRDIEVLKASQHPTKMGLSTREGQARLMHDLANIELQAMELGFRTLVEYPGLPQIFREELGELILQEANHLDLCLKLISSFGHQFGDWPIHNLLWEAVSAQDDPIDRILIVHRYLEGAGLDAGEMILRRLSSVDAKALRQTVKFIADEEVGHVEFGSKWFRHFCRLQGLNESHEFSQRLDSLWHRLPRRLENLAWERRRQAGFSESELNYLSEKRQFILSQTRPAIDHHS